MDALKKAYLGLPPALRRRVPVAWELWLYDRLRARLAGSGRPRALESKLWGGFSTSALAELTALADDPATPARTAAEAALALAGWAAVAEDFAAALTQVERAAACGLRDRRQVMLEALFRCRLGQGPEARALLAAHGPRGFDVSAALMRANTYAAVAGGAPEDAATRLAHLNAIYRRHGLQSLTLRDPGAPLSLDNLTGRAGLTGNGVPLHGPKVTVILPLYNAEATVLTALHGLAAQSWQNLEVLVVDDASTDAGPALVAAFATRDPRFRLIRQPANRGGYAARNRALAEATGTYLTAHDADDWSHPDKIARQMQALRSAPYNLSAWVRTGADLFFWGPSRPSQTLVGTNHSSALIPTELVRRLGGWDAVRVAADTELIWRIERSLGTPPGSHRARIALPGVPLAFGRLDTGSLTRSTASHILTNLHGLRREYLEAAAHWHAGLPRLANPRTRLAAQPPFSSQPPVFPQPPFFPAPPVLRPERSSGPAQDLLLIGDFNFAGGTFHSAMHMLRAGHAAGMTCAILQYRRYDQNVTLPLKSEVRAEAWAKGVRIVAPGEALRATTVIVTYPVILAHVMDRFPQVDHDRLAVVVNQMAERDLARSDPAYDPAVVRATLRKLFGHEGTWLPISDRVRDLMAADPRYPAPDPATWTPLIEAAAWGKDPPRWRGNSLGDNRAQPVLGRHGRDHPLKWPRDRAALAAAYCANRPCMVRFLGGARQAQARLKPWPRNWQVAEFDSEDVRGFLRGLDVFLHFPDRDYIEEFGRAPMEAMAVGVPVILPPEFRPTFGAAALYAEPEGVWPLVERLWADRAFWESRVAAGRDFVATNCDYTVFPARIAALARTLAPV